MLKPRAFDILFLRRARRKAYTAGGNDSNFCASVAADFCGADGSNRFAI